jgi:hypothetical protein
MSTTGWWIAGTLLAIGLAALASVTFAIAACVLASRRYRDPRDWDQAYIRELGRHD